jgi:hypothetical protein
MTDSTEASNLTNRIFNDEDAQHLETSRDQRQYLCTMESWEAHYAHGIPEGAD